MSDMEPTLYQAGFVAVMGKPNVGKSTLINALLGQKIAAVSPRPQTTRKRQMGILTIEGSQAPSGETPTDEISDGETSGTETPDGTLPAGEPRGGAQIVFVDTPGVHRPRHKLGELMNQEATQVLEESDVILFVVDAGQPPDDDDRLLFELLRKLRRRAPVVLALNKRDTLNDEMLEQRQQAYLEGAAPAEPVAVSATRSEGLDELLQAILAQLPERAPYFPEDQVTDLYERDIAADLIREAALVLLRDEVPHGIAVRIDQFEERGDAGAYIEATLFVERESHKGIVIGQGGQMLKRIGTQARQEIETMSGRKVFLQLKIKVRKNWRDDEKTLKSFGY